jgi:hypothetical protein
LYKNTLFLHIMKKLLFLSALLLTTVLQAQDYTFIEKSKQLNSQEAAISFATEITAVTNPTLRFYKLKEFTNLNKFKIVFVPNALKDEDIENDNVSNEDQAGFLSFVFNIDFVGANKDLERLGVKQYRLIETESKYLTMFPIWQKYYKSTAQLEGTLKDYKSQRLIEPEKDIRYIFQDQGDNWLILQR